MKPTTWISTCALVAALSLGSGAIAQDTKAKTIAGQPVSEAQLQAVQERCDELRAASAGGMAMSGPAESAPTAEAPAADAPAAGASAEPQTTESAAEAPVQPDGDAPQAQGGNMAAEDVDLATLTVELCEEGGFTATTM